jgi:class 3 adenylate cyclase/DNA-binding winged helix-turn-helix (wHTH) protein/predicted ATPase
MRYVFGDAIFDTERCEVLRAGMRLALRPKVYQLLLHLLEHRHRIVSKQELLEQVWPDQYIGDATLLSCIKAVRQAVGDTGRTQRIIETRHRRGYRFVAAVTAQDEGPPADLTPPLSAPAETLSQPVAADDRIASGTGLLPPAAPREVRDSPVLPLQRCPECQQAQSPAAIFCTVCGARLLPESVLPSARATAELTGEHKLVTVLCCALAEAPRLALRLGLEGMHALMQAWLAHAQAIVQQYGGTVLQFGGDGFSAVFGVPQAQEDHAQRAVRAALGLRQRLRETPDLQALTQGVGVSVSIGLHTGSVVVEYLGEEAQHAATTLGVTTALATRLQQAAAPDTLLLSEATYRLVRAAIQATVREPVEGIAGSVYTVESTTLTAPGARRSDRPHSPFVGRVGEFALLHECLAAVARGQGRAISLVGEPGIGKSRILAEFHHRLAGQAVTYRAGHCLPDGSATPYLPLQALVQQACGLMATDDVATITAKVRQTLHDVGLVPDTEAPLLLRLLDVPTSAESLARLSPQARKARTFTLLHSLHRYASQRQPLVLAIEDLHWIDATSAEYLAALVEQLAGTALLLLVTHRPDYRPPWLAHAAVTQVTLPGLLPQDSAQVVQSVGQTMDLPPSLVATIIAKAGGNPLFLEELTWACSTDRAFPTAVPDTIQTVLAARIDHLAPADKRLLQMAAVLGTDVRVPLLQAMTAMPADELHQRLQTLQTLDFLQLTRLLPEAVYTFKHVLTQEVAYQSMLRRARRHLHQRLAEVLSTQFPAIAATQPAFLARHYTAAGLAAPAVFYWQRAGEHAVERSAYVEAIRHYTQGLELLETLPDTPERWQHELLLQVALGVPLRATKGTGAPEVERTYTRALALCQQVGDTRLLFPIMGGLVMVYLTQAEYTKAYALAEQILQRAQHAQMAFFIGVAHIFLGIALLFRGELLLARPHLEQGMSLYDPQWFRQQATSIAEEPGVPCLSYLAYTLWRLGYPDQALQRLQETLNLAQELARPLSEVVALYYATALHELRGEVQQVCAGAERLIAKATEQEFAQWRALGMVNWGWALVHRGESTTGLAYLRQGAAAVAHTGQRLGTTRVCAILADGYARAGQGAEGLQVLATALAFIEHTGERFYEAEVYRLKGELTLLSADGTPSDGVAKAAERDFMYALTLARDQAAKSWELRAAMSLSRLWLRQGKRTEAYELLAPVYGWFTEGFNTADLLQARALLETLA